jgi:hypothetical protein
LIPKIKEEEDEISLQRFIGNPERKGISPMMLRNNERTKLFCCYDGKMRHADTTGHTRSYSSVVKPMLQL